MSQVSSRYGQRIASPGSSIGAGSAASRNWPSPSRVPGGAPPRMASAKLPMGSPEELAQSRATAYRHYTELYDFLTEGGQQPPPARNSAREKLTRLTRQQFQELSTDVYDELLRRKSALGSDTEPFLPVQEGFHPKRNQARQKLATLPESRYRDLASDVYFELERRYPEFKEESARSQLFNGGSQGPRPTASSAANEVLVPNKSTLVEEDVGMPPPRNKTPSPKSENERYEEREVLGDLGRSRASEASSIGTSRIIGGYGQRTDSRAWDNSEQEKLRSDYEYKIATMQQRITSLESDLQGARADAQNRGRDAVRIKELEDDLKAHQQQHEEHSNTIRTLQRDIDSHKTALARQQDSREDVGRLRRDFDSAQAAIRERDEIVDDLRKEVKGLLDELRSLSGRQDETMNERQRDHDRIRQLEGQVTSHRQRYEAVKTELRNVKATSALFVEPPEHSDYMPASDEGAIADIHMTAFQSSIDSLLVAGRSEQPSSVLSMTKQVVFAVTRLDEDITEYEGRHPHAMSEDDNEALQALKAKCNATLSNLVTAAKNHAASYGMSPVSLLDAAASHLSVTVIDLARLVRLRKASREEMGADGRPLPSPLPQVSPPRALNPIKSSPPRANGGNVSPPNTRVGALRRADSPTSSRGSPISPLRPDSAGSQGPNGVSRPREDPLDSRDSRYAQNPRYGSTGSQMNAPMSATVPLSAPYDPPRGGEESRGRIGGLSPEYGRRHDDEYGNSPIEMDRHNGYSREEFYPVQNYEELKEYCEQQTETIVHSIQALLAAVRSGASGEEIHENLTQIINVVTSIVGVTKGHMPAHAKREGDHILADLSQSCDKLSSMQAASHESFSKETKQKLASVSFGAAKALKALNSFLAREAIDT